MGLYHNRLKNTDGLLFYKLLGTGKNPGFRVTPDFKTYALLTSWKSEEACDSFMDESYLKEFKIKCNSIRYIKLLTISCSGLWNNQKPFIPNENIKKNDLLNSKIAVITRGGVKISKALNFWTSISPASKSISRAKGVRFYKGMGELPLFEQATFSIWDSIDHIKKFAYKDDLHLNIVKKAKEQNWYKEDLFARFLVKSDIIE